MGILGDIFGIASSVAGLSGAKKSNQQAAQAYETQKGYAGQEVDIASLMKKLAEQYQAQGSGYSDAFGGGVQYDPATGTWKAKLGPQQLAIQNSSDAETLKHNTYDTGVRRDQLGTANRAGMDAAGEADTARRQYDLFNQGIGQVDPNKLASTLALNRTSAVNSGFDDAQRAAGTISLRTGASAGDALSRLARSRASAVAQARGDPELDALNAAEPINQGRRNSLLQSYNLFNNAGTGVSSLDSGFNPSEYGNESTNNLFKTQALDQSKFGLVNDALGTSAATIGSAAAGLRGASDSHAKNTNNAAMAQFLAAIGAQSDKIGSDVMKMFSGMGG